MKTIGTLFLAALAFTGSTNAEDFGSFKKFNNSDNFFPPAKRFYEVTVTNITRGQTFTPILAASHKQSISFFELGEPANDGIIAIAESGNVAPFQEVLDASKKKVMATSTSKGLLGPGESTSFNIAASSRFSRISLAAMLLPTNDTFVSIDSIRLPEKFFGTRTVLARAYDAGSETNDELCASIPGPQCGGEGMSSNDLGEGYVHISAGISGEAELPAMQYDWRDMVAKVTIKRVR